MSARWLLAVLLASACAREAAPPAAVPTAAEAGRSPTPDGRGPTAPALSTEASVQAVLEGEASYYSDKLAGRKTASGERYDPQALTAAHRTLPFGSVVRVIRPDTGRAVVVRITDRGPFGKASRIIDLSKAAARDLDMLRAGVVSVRIEVLSSNRD